MNQPWDGAVVVVTGAATGIGRALARQLVERGAAVHAVDHDELGLAGLDGVVGTHVVDVTDAAEVTAMMLAVAAQHGRLDVVFNNAGVFVAGDFESITDATWEHVVGVNLWGVIHGTRAAYSLMVERGHGHIVNTASSAGVLPVARSAAYAATKHGVVGLSTSLRAEAAKHGVKVSVVVPGLVDTGIFDKARDLTGFDYQRQLDRVPFRKVTPEQAASAILAGVERNQQFIAFPRYNRVLWRLNRLMPDVMTRVVNR